MHADHPINGGLQIWGAGCLLADVATEANARLIAAAPELLAALQRAEALLSIAYNPGIEDSVTLTATNCQWATNAARAAILKATGHANP